MKDCSIAVIGLGYVGLPLAVEFAKKYPVTGFDINKSRVSDLRSCHDFTLEVSTENLMSVVKKETGFSEGLYVTSEIEDLKTSNFYIVTVPNFNYL